MITNLAGEECNADGNITNDTKGDDEGVEWYKKMVSNGWESEIFILTFDYEYWPWDLLVIWDFFVMCFW